MSTSSLASSCAIKADRCSGRVLSAESIMVLMFQHASLSPFPPFKASGIRHLFIDLFDVGISFLPARRSFQVECSVRRTDPTL